MSDTDGEMPSVTTVGRRAGLDLAFGAGLARGHLCQCKLNVGQDATAGTKQGLG